MKDFELATIKTMGDVDNPHMQNDARHMDAETLFRNHGRFVSSFLARLGARPHDLDDLVQEVFLTAHRQGGFIPAGAKPTTWLSEIAFRVLSTSRREKWKRAVDFTEDALVQREDPGGTPLENVLANDSLQCIARALDALDFDMRVVFVLFEMEAEPCDSIAKALGIPVGTVYSRLHRARQIFQEAFERQQWAETRPMTQGVRP